MLVLASLTLEAKAVVPPRFGFVEPGTSYQQPWYMYSVASTGSMFGRAQERQDIRATPILDRPSRVGHFYGNTVRRANGR